MMDTTHLTAIKELQLEVANLQWNDILKQIVREESSIAFQVIQAQLKPYAHGLNQYLAALFVWKDISKDKIHKSY